MSNLTPWDNWGRERLLMEVRRMYDALASASSALRIASHGDETGYWSSRGTGGSAIAKAAMVLKPYAGKAEKIYRSYYRNRSFLLFGTGIRWHTCSDGHLFGESEDGIPPTECMICHTPLEPLAWKHFEDKVKPRGKGVRP